MAVTAGSPVIMRSLRVPTNGVSSPSPSSAESSFRELDDAFLQTQTSIWLGEVLQIRFDEEMNISDLLADGELLFEVSEVLSRMLPNAAEAPHLRVNEGKFLASSKSTKRYMPYYNVGSFLKMCKSLGLNGIDLFSPSDVVEKRNTRKVCMCIRSLSKKVRSRDLNVPDFDSVTCTLSMPTYMVEGIRKSLELSQCSSSLSAGHDSERTSRNRYWQRTSNSDSLVSNGYSSDNCDDAESSFVDAESNGPLEYACSAASLNILGSQVTKEYSPCLDLQLNSEDPENDENVQCEYLSPSTPESVASPCSFYYSDQELSSPLPSTCLASCITGINCEANHGYQNDDVNHVPVDWGDVSSDDGYRDGNADNDVIGHVSHDKDDSDTNSSDSCSLTRENSTVDGGRDLDVSDECVVQDCCAGDQIPLSKFGSPDNEQPSCTEMGTGTQTGTGSWIENDNSLKFKGGFGCWDVPKYPNGDVLETGNDNCLKLPYIIDEQVGNDAAKHGMVTSELSPEVSKPDSDRMVKDNDLPHELIETIHHASSLIENLDCCSSNDGDCISQVEESSLLVDSDVHSSICPCPVAVKSNGSDDHWICANPVTQSQASTQLLPGRDSWDTIVAADDHSLTQNENEAFDLMVGNGSNAVEIPDMDLNSSPCMVVLEDSIKCLNQDSQDTLDGFKDHNIRAAHINGRPVNIEDSTSVNGFSATLCYPQPVAERMENVEETDHKHHPCAENMEKAEPEDKGTDKEMPQSKSKSTLIKSVVKGTAIVGLAVFLFHIRKNSRGHIPKVEKQPIEVLKRSLLKCSSQKSEKGGNSSSVDPAQKRSPGDGSFNLSGK